MIAYIQTYMIAYIQTYMIVYIHTFICHYHSFTLFYLYNWTIFPRQIYACLTAPIPRFYLSLSLSLIHTLFPSPLSQSLSLCDCNRAFVVISLSFFLAISLTRIDQCPSTCQKWTNEEKNLFFVKSKVTTTKEFWNVKIAWIIFASVIALTTLVLDWLDQILLSSYCQLVINK